MGTLIGLTGPIGSGKSTFADFLAATAQSHARYESSFIIAEIADAFNRALKAELAYETSKSQIELANQVLIWLPDIISESLHQDVTWNQLAITKHDTLTHPELYEKLFAYMNAVQKAPAMLDAQITDSNKEQYRSLLQWLGGYFVAKISRTIWYDEIMRRIDLRDATTSLVLVGGVRYPSDAQVIREHDGGTIILIERSDAPVRAGDVTEAERSAIKPDITVANNGTLEQLQQLAATLADDLQAGDPKPHYSAA